MQQEQHDDSEELVNSLEQKMERLRSLYEMYFAGVEKRPPDFPHKEVVRILYELEKRQIKNTGVKYKLRQLVQKFNSYRTYWVRTCRQIEEGTYKRLNDRVDAKRKHQARQVGVDLDAPKAPAPSPAAAANKAKKPAEPDIPVFAEDFEEADPHSAAVAALESWSIEINMPTPKAAPPKAPAPPAAPQAPQPAAQAPQPRPSGPTAPAAGPVQFGGVGMGGRLAPMPAAMAAGSAEPPTSRPGLTADEANKADALRRKLELLKANAPSGPASRPGGPSSGPISRPTSVDAPPSAPAAMAAPPATATLGAEGARPAPRLGLAAQAALQGQAPRVGGVGGLARPSTSLSSGSQPAGQAPPAQPAAQPATQPASATPRPSAPPPRPTAAAGIARPSWGSTPSSPGATPSAPPSAAGGGGDAESRSALRGAGISEQRLGEIHRNLVQAKQQCNEPTQSLSVDNVARLMAKQLPTLREKYGSGSVDFEVVVKEGKTYLKPKAQK